METSRVPHARNAKNHPGRALSEAPRTATEPGRLRSFPSHLQMDRVPTTPATLEKSVSARAGPGRPPSHPQPEAGGPSRRRRGPLTWLPAAVAARRQLVHLDASPAALQHHQAPARAAHLAHHLSFPEQRVAEARGRGEEPDLRAPRLCGGGPGRGRPGCGWWRGLGGRPERRARAAPRPPRRPLLHRRFPGLHGRTSALRRRGFSQPGGKTKEGKDQGLKGSTAHRRRGAVPASGLLRGVEGPRPALLRPCSDASLPTCCGWGRSRPV